jgi:recombination protein RecR
VCGNLDDTDPCGICQDTRRDPHSLCVVEEVADAWALERTGLVQGRYHILGGVLSALDGRTPDMLRLESLYHRVAHHRIAEVIVATNGTVEGQATAHYIVTLLRPLAVRVTRPAYGIPVGGELEYLDDGTLDAAFRARKLQET